MYLFSFSFCQIPLPVTTGLFLYLGVSGLSGNEMWERTKLLVTDAKLRPKSVSTLSLFIFVLSCVASLVRVCRIYRDDFYIYTSKLTFAAVV